MSTEALGGSDAISVRELADMRSAGKEHTVLDVREARELDICQLARLMQRFDNFAFVSGVLA